MKALVERDATKLVNTIWISNPSTLAIKKVWGHTEHQT